MCKGTIPIHGVKNVKRAEEKVGALGWRLTPGEAPALDDASKQVRRLSPYQNQFLGFHEITSHELVEVYTPRFVAGIPRDLMKARLQRSVDECGDFSAQNVVHCE